MAVYDQPKTTYSDTTPAIRVIDEAIRLIDPIDTPLLAKLGGLNGAASKFNVRGKGTKIELLEDDYHPTSGTTNDTLETDTLIIAVTDGSLYQDGMVLKTEDSTDTLSAYGSDEIADVTGAGDTVLAAYALAMASGATRTEATILANIAGGLQVQRAGTATIPQDVLIKEWNKYCSDPNNVSIEVMK
ncbi:hypothetical protein LCGC14_2585220 [marine sediment metagenome]|uniref:Carbohydrate kinase PfkB domain-containing protein n=1 Tax=marine sediment metagenome TaxID=412755 RepID=A0A0F9D609_9ZZZZ